MQISGISSGFMGFALAACVSAVCIESRGQICDHDEHHVLTGNLDDELQGVSNNIGYEHAFRHQIEPHGAPASSNCPDIQVTLMDVLQTKVFGTRSQLSCLVLDALWNDIVDAPLFSGLYYDGKMQAKTFEELVSFNYGETFLISGWEYSNLVAVYGEHFARVTFDLRITTECQNDGGDNRKYFHEQVQILAYCRGAEDKITELHRTQNNEANSTFLNQMSNDRSCLNAINVAWNGTFPPPPSICYHL
ncbi:hypothetical protein MHU86_22839 [Fragilaria crotonensis]|nr:hypothetical protein MHU86_22839 [Fragilaria crotonensis]